MKYKSATCSDRKVRLAGDTALVTGRAAIEAEINGQPRSLRLVFLNVWTLLRSLDDDQPRAATVSLSGPLG